MPLQVYLKISLLLPKWKKESVLHEAWNGAEKIQQRAEFLTKNAPNIIYHVTRFGPYEIYLAVGGFIQRPLTTDWADKMNKKTT